MTPTTYKHHCVKCGNDWKSYLKRPKNCPACKSASWDRSYRRSDMLGMEKQVGKITKTRTWIRQSKSRGILSLKCTNCGHIQRKLIDVRESQSLTNQCSNCKEYTLVVMKRGTNMTKKQNSLLILRHDTMYHEGFQKPYDRSDEIASYKIGEHYIQSVAAPGTGYYEYEITSITPVGMFGRLIKDTVRDLEAWEVY